MIPERGEELELLLRTWLDDDDAVDVAGWIISEPESVSQAAYDHYSRGSKGE